MPTNTDYKIYCNSEMIAQTSTALLAQILIEGAWALARNYKITVKYAGWVVFNSRKADGDPRSIEHIIKGTIAKHMRERRETVLRAIGEWR